MEDPMFKKDYEDENGERKITKDSLKKKWGGLLYDCAYFFSANNS